MTPELENLLYNRYPDFFARHNWSTQESSMAWGCATSDGWFSLIDAVGETIIDDAKATGRPVPQASQVKEKFGGLRIYLGAGNEFDHAVVDIAEGLSFWTCEVTGRPGGLVNCGGYIQTLCPEVALQRGISIRVPVPRPSARSKRLRPILKGPIDVPRGWLRIVNCMLLGLLHHTGGTPISIDRIATEGDHLRVAADNLTTVATGIITFCQAIARRTDRKTGALHVPALSQDSR